MREHLTGQFTPGTSILHRLDARAKFFGFLILIAATVCTDAWPGYALLLAVTAAVVAICGLPLRTALASVARMGWFFLLIFAMNALFFATDDAIWHWWILTLSVPGIVQGAQVTVRLALILVLSNVLTCTTPPLEITGAIQTLLSPLRLVRLPVEDIAMILSVAVQFIPTLLEETDTIRKAQIARGSYSMATWVAGSVVKSWPGTVIQLVFIPSIVFALMKARLIPERYPKEVPEHD